MQWPKIALIAGGGAALAWWALKPKAQTAPTETDTGTDWSWLPGDGDWFDVDEFYSYWDNATDTAGNWIADTYEEASDWLSGVWDYVTE